ncbi:hypothetical protein ACFS5N_07430 [Mucilaginibacter ximonensis]|uniref:Carboxypeptidase-like protein n=1 Tax=Mucilaginibacter ximonensis TaxID=538021 RepID=A0ABW5YAJ4_9SPHI
MKNFFIFIYCIISLNAIAQTGKLNKFHLVDKITNKPVVTSVSILKAKLSITTEKDGIFVIPGELKTMTDSVIFSAQNYDDIKMPLAALSALDTIRLNRSNFEENRTERKFVKDTLLNDFRDEDVVHFAGLHDGAGSFNYLQIAQEFYTDKINTRLDALQIERLSFNLDTRYGMAISDEKHQKYQQIEFTKFKVRVYDIDAATGKPGRDLCDRVIEVNIKSSERARIKLKSYNIIIPHKSFFVAIEWMRDYYNAHYTVILAPNTSTRDKLMSYKPAIGISPVTGKKLNIWVLSTNHDWFPFTTFSPFGTDLAIKATVSY